MVLSDNPNHYFSKKDYPDYLLIKDLPGYKAGCIFSMANNYIYYISINPETSEYKLIDKADKYIDGVDNFIRFNIFQMENNPEWFLKIDDQVLRDMKIDNIL